MTTAERRICGKCRFWQHLAGARWHRQCQKFQAITGRIGPRVSGLCPGCKHYESFARRVGERVPRSDQRRQR